jgi:hypothetical protein
MKILSRSVLLCVLLAATAGCDRVTKHLAMTNLAGMPEQSFLADTIRLDYHENPGGFLSTGATWRPEIRAIVFSFPMLCSWSLLVSWPCGTGGPDGQRPV